MGASGTWAFDVDGTLIGSIRSDRLRPGAAELLAALVERGVTCVLWSAGGDEYAARKAREHGIDGHVVRLLLEGGTRRVTAATSSTTSTRRIGPTCSSTTCRATCRWARRSIAVPQFFGGNTGRRRACCACSTHSTSTSARRCRRRRERRPRT